ncbi:hypothetical protein Salat_2677600 [Sesamum alatum]|uniref:Uncharacterized protein n=1 Tax=Sesamum alatum TaxID=300844 RepID=A0AAE1XPI2_9LAMI|nr:hypothetical protein Salat_2677600 [Sesamum alatum]
MSIGKNTPCLNENSAPPPSSPTTASDGVIASTPATEPYFVSGRHSPARSSAPLVCVIAHTNADLRTSLRFRQPPPPPVSPPSGDPTPENPPTSAPPHVPVRIDTVSACEASPTSSPVSASATLQIASSSTVASPYDVAGVRSGDIADSLLLNRCFTLRRRSSRPTTEYLSRCSYTDTEICKLPNTGGTPSTSDTSCSSSEKKLLQCCSTQLNNQPSI